MEVLLTLFVFGSVWFWLLLIATSGFLCVFSEHKKGLWATFFLFVTLLLFFSGNFGVLVFLKENPFTVLLSVVGYFVLGAVWSYFKWDLYLEDEKEVYEEFKKEWTNKDGTWKREDDAKNTYPYLQMKHIVENGALGEKERIVTWMAFWPWSFVWTFINDFVLKIFNRIFRFMRGLYDRTTARILGDIAHDFQ